MPKRKKIAIRARRGSDYWDDRVRKSMRFRDTSAEATFVSKFFWQVTAIINTEEALPKNGVSEIYNKSLEKCQLKKQNRYGRLGAS